MKEIKVIFRKVRWTNPDGIAYEDIEAFFPQLSSTYGNIDGCCKDEGWFSANLEWYWNSNPVTESEYKEFLEWLQENVFDKDEKLVVRKRLRYSDLTAAWIKNDFERKM